MQVTNWRNTWLRSIWEKTLCQALGHWVYKSIHSFTILTCPLWFVTRLHIAVGCMGGEFMNRFEWLWRHYFATWSRNISPVSPQFLNECLLCKNTNEIFRQEKLMIKFGRFIFLWFMSHCYVHYFLQIMKNKSFMYLTDKISFIINSNSEFGSKDLCCKLFWTSSASLQTPS